MAPKDIGTVDFATSCNPATKTKFNEAVALLHSFWFAESRAVFESVLKDDPDCAIAYWGIALTHWGNPFAGLRAAADDCQRQGRHRQGTGHGHADRAREGLLDAVAILFSSADVTTQRQRVLDYERAMGRALAGQQGRRRGAHLLGVVGGAGGIADRQDLRAAVAGGGDSRADVREACRITLASRTTSSTPTTCRCWRRRR